MLVKWAIEGRRRLAKPSPSGNAEDQQRSASAPAPSNGYPSAPSATTTEQSQISQVPVAFETPARHPSLAAELDRLHYQSDTALAKSSETADDRAKRRIHAEEKASRLRDDKLLSLTGREGGSQESYQGTGQSHLPLTQENMQKLAREAEPAVSRHPRQPDRHSSGVLEDEPKSGIEHPDRMKGSVRPSLEAAQMKSESTITGGQLT